MTRDEIVEFWIKSSDKDFMTMNILFKEKQYSWSLFIGHLVIEKLLKAYYVMNVDTNHSLTHDLVRITEKSELELTDEQRVFFATVTTFNIMQDTMITNLNLIRFAQRNLLKSGIMK